MASPVIQFKRGLLADLPGLRAGEPGFTTDAYDLYVGIDSTTSNNQFVGSGRYWQVNTSTVGSGVKLVEGTDNGTNSITLKAPDSLAGITTYTMPSGATSGFMKITSSSQSGNDYDISLGFASVLQDLVDDTTPQLGGNLDLNSNNITGTGDINITGDITGTNVTVGSTSFATLNRNVSNLAGLTGVSTDSTDLGTFTGSTITDNSTIKTALQELETGLDNISGGNASATSVATASTDTDASHFLTFVADNNATKTQENVLTDAGITYNPSSNLLTAGEVSVTTLDIGGTDVTSTAAELNFLDGSTADGEVVASKAIIASPERNLANLGIITATTFTGALSGNVTGNVTGNVVGNVTGNVTGDLNGDVNAGIVTTSSFTLTGTAVTAILDEDTLASNRADALATQQSIKAYVDSQVTAQDLDFAGDSGTGAVDLDSQSLTIAGTANEVETSASGQTLTIGLPSSVTVTTSLTTPTVQASAVKANDGTAAITITDSTGAVELAQNLTVAGNLYVNGSTTQVNTSQTTIEDQLLELGMVDGSAPSSDLNKDIGVLFNYYTDSAKKAGVYWDDSTSRIAVAAVVTESSGVLTASTMGALEIGSLWVNDCAGTSQVINCSGSVRTLENITLDGGSF